MDFQGLSAAGRAEVAHYRGPHAEQHQQASSRVSELRPPPQRYSSHTAHLAAHARVVRSSLPKESSSCTHHVPRTAVLWRLLAAMMIVLFFVQAVSCGLFFCVRLPFGHGPYADYRDLISELDAGTPAEAADAGKAAVAAASTAYAQQQLSSPKLIPRAIHQTSHSPRLSATAKQLMRSWKERNGDSFQLRFYSNGACLNFVRREFPEYFEAYTSLPKDVERADFFRYMILLRLGGVYADIDVECRQPLDSVIQPADTLLVGWDAEESDLTAAAELHMARQRQVASWFFAAAPGHPVLRHVCDHIARNAMTVFSNNTVRDTLERTGQGVFTDMVLKWALQHPPAQHDDPWKVRILPRVTFGVRASELSDELRPDLPGVVVLHHFQNSWQGRWPVRRKALQNLIPWRRSGGALLESLERVHVTNVTHYPVSVDFYPPFTMMTDLVGTGDRQTTADVSAAITAHGTWQPAVAPFRRPAVVEALVGPLGRHSSTMGNGSAAATATAATASGLAAAGSSKAAIGSVSNAGQAAAARGSSSITSGNHPVHQGVLIDIGAGHGFFSLAAAARGHRVVSFETSAGSLSAFKASIAYNGFGGLIDLHEAALGNETSTVCLSQRKDIAAVAAQPPSRQHSNHDSKAARWAVDNGSSQSSAAEHQRPHSSEAAQVPAASDSQNTDCTKAVPQVRLSDVLINNTAAAVIRISAHGQEGWILEGALEHLAIRTKPELIYVEFWSAAMQAAGYSKPTRLVRQLYDLGYTDIAHAGHVCDRRWQNVTQVMRSQGTYSVSAHNIAQQQPTWCKLRPENFLLLVDLAKPDVPENILFVLGHEASQQQQVNSTAQRRKQHQTVGGQVADAGGSAPASRYHTSLPMESKGGNSARERHAMIVPTADGSAAIQPQSISSGVADAGRQQQVQQRVLGRRAGIHGPAAAAVG